MLTEIFVSSLFVIRDIWKQNECWAAAECKKKVVAHLYDVM